MARITGPSALSVPGFSVGSGTSEIPVLVPIDLPEGGFLQIVLGENALRPPDLLLPLPRGCMVALLGPQTVDEQLPGLRADPRVGEAQAVQLNGDQPNPVLLIHGQLPLERPLWLPAGGLLQAIVGENKNALPIPSTPVPKGSILAIIPPAVAEQVRAGLELAAKHNPYAIVPNGLMP
jgi:hypothetical protein